MMKNKNVPKIRFKGFVEEWEETTLGNIADIVGGGTPSTSIKEYWEGDINWYSPAEIGKNIFVDKSLRNITEQGLNNCSAQILPIGTVLFSSRAGIGSVAILAKEAATNQGFQSILPHKGKLDSYFIYSRSRELKHYGETNGAGSTFVEVSGKQMACMPIVNPSIEEQTHIGNFFKNLDNLIHLNRKKLEKLKNFKKASLEKMFPKKGATTPEIRFKGFSGEWEEKRLGDIGEFRSNGVDKKIHANEEDVYLLNYMDVYTRREISATTCNKLMQVTAKLEQIKNNNVLQNDVFFTPSSETPDDIGRVMVIPETLPNTVYSYHLIRYRPKENYFAPFFPDYGFACSHIRKQMIFEAQGVQRFVINKSSFDNLLILLPEIEEQERIAIYLKKIDRLITKQQTQLAKLQNIKKACLDKMFVTKA